MLVDGSYFFFFLSLGWCENFFSDLAKSLMKNKLKCWEVTALFFLNPNNWLVELNMSFARLFVVTYSKQALLAHSKGNTPCLGFVGFG